LVLLLGTLAAVIVQVLVIAGVGGESVTTAVSDLGGVLVIGAAAFITIRTALRFGKGEALRNQWLSIGIGIVLYVLGDVVWTYIEVIKGLEPPFPGVPDLFYMSLYVFMGYGIVSAAFAYKGLVRVRTPLIASVVISVASAAALYVVLVKDILADASVGTLEKALDIYYPLADTLLLLLPALFIVFVVSQLGRGALAIPWRFVVAGVSLLAVADTVYQWLEWQELYGAGSIVDLGWMLGYVLIATGASAMHDLIVPRVRA
jgi:hypothetical protein